MSASDRARELIQKSLEAIASNAEHAELERLLASDPEVAAAFADAARLHVSLMRHFGKQQKIEQVASLLGQDFARTSSATPSDSSDLVSGDTSEFDISAIDLRQFDPGHLDPAVAAAGPSISSYVARDSKAIRLYDSQKCRRARLVRRGWKWASFAAVLLVSAFLWSWWASRLPVDRFRIVVGHVAIAAHEVAEVPINVAFEVIGGSSAVLELPGGGRLELTSATRGTLHQDNQKNSRQVVLNLESGGGVVTATRGSISCRVRTAIADITTTDGKVSFSLVLAETSQSTKPVLAHRSSLIVSVTEGSTTVEQAGVSTGLRVGQRQTFFGKS